MKNDECGAIYAFCHFQQKGIGDKNIQNIVNIVCEWPLTVVYQLHGIHMIQVTEAWTNQKIHLISSRGQHLSHTNTFAVSRLQRMLFYWNQSKKNFCFCFFLYRVAHMYLNDFMRLFWGHWVTYGPPCSCLLHISKLSNQEYSMTLL